MGDVLGDPRLAESTPLLPEGDSLQQRRPCPRVRIPRRAQDGLQRSWLGVVAKIRTRSGSGARVTVILSIIHGAGIAVKKLSAR
jgi:hypothetical protein